MVKRAYWKAKVLPYSFLAVRKRASLAGGLLSSKNWWEVCMNFSCYHEFERDEMRARVRDTEIEGQTERQREKEPET